MMANPPKSRLTRDRLLAGYTDHRRPRSRWKVGLELERHLLLPDGRPVPYHDGHGVRWLLEQLVQRGWRPYREAGALISVIRGSAAVTLEPGGQFELSGAPYRTVAEAGAEAHAFADEVAGILRDTEVRQVSLGFTPYASVPSIPWVPKGRYVVMREHMARSGPLGHHMMKGTAATQASYDFADEVDCARKVTLAVAMAPLTTAMFANSPYSLGRRNGWQSYRGHIWTRTDPDRTGMPPASEGFSFERWVDYLLDAPMMFTRVRGRWLPARGRTFRQWMDDGIDGTWPDEDAWELHLTSVFPEVRIKRTIEVRGADCVPLPLSLAFAALFEGLFYDQRAREQATAVAQRFASFGTKEARFEVACRDGLRGMVGGYRLATWAEALVDAARGGLERYAPKDAPLLAPLIDLVEHGETHADRLLAALGDRPDPARLQILASHRGGTP